MKLTIVPFSIQGETIEIQVDERSEMGDGVEVTPTNGNMLSC